jgi:deazaflavin-dependent oxidoreductase (nitroreductase family)
VKLRHVDPLARRGLGYRLYAWLVGTRPMGRVSRAIGWRLDPVLMRLSSGRVGFGLALPTALLETRGARTGALRRTVVIYFHDGDRVCVVASKLGLPENPSWFYNLLAHPDVVFGGEPFRAFVVEDPAELVRLWPLAYRVFPGYAAYRRRAAGAGREIPLVALVPASREAVGGY